jgi:hypothetical protein
LGIPENRIRTVTPQLICTRFVPEYKKIDIDILIGKVQLDILPDE